MFSEYIAGILVLLLFYYFVKKPRNYVKNVPGPKPNIIFGNVLDAIAPRHKQLSILTEYMRKYGNTVKLQVGPFKEVVITSDIKLVEFLLSSTKFIEKSAQYKIADKWLGNSLFTATSAHWRKQRKMLNPSFHVSVLSRYIDVFEQMGGILMKKLENEVDNDKVDMYPLFSLCTLEIICAAAMGTSVDAQPEGKSEFLASLFAITDLMVIRTLVCLPDWLYCLTPMHFWEKRMLKAYHSYTERVIDRKIETLKNVDDSEGSFDEKKRPDFLSFLLTTEIDGRPLNRIEIRDQVDTFIFGGQHTTASSLSFILYCLAHHPDVQEKAYEEQKKLFGDDVAPEMTIKNLQDMKYLETVIKESMRTYPPGPFVGRKIEEELKWGDMILPKDTDIVLFIHEIHKNPEIFPEPEQFKPERFETDDVKHSYTFLPFSAGPRNCIGKMFAMLEMKSVISKILRNFIVLPSKPDPELKLVPKLVLTPIDGCCVSLKKR